MSWAIRNLTADDQNLLWELLYVALWDPPDTPRRPRSVLDDPRIRRLVEDWGRDEDFGLVALEPNSGAPAGAVWTRLDRHDGLEDYGCPFPALGVAVFPEFHRRGAGHAMMSEFIKSLRPRVAGLRLGVHPKNTAARSLYEKLGFTEYAIGAGGYPQMKLVF